MDTTSRTACDSSIREFETKSKARCIEPATVGFVSLKPNRRNAVKRSHEKISADNLRHGSIVGFLNYDGCYDGHHF